MLSSETPSPILSFLSNSRQRDIATFGSTNKLTPDGDAGNSPDISEEDDDGEEPEGAGEDESRADGWIQELNYAATDDIPRPGKNVKEFEEYELSSMIRALSKEIKILHNVNANITNVIATNASDLSK
ncbi:hypothetical protein BGZ58_001054 [Dissophora ornata]|nr:hypothetical protein BGZ58_001054 [Dissophora ornata]